ncbi:MAG: pyruvate formate lyase family protein [Desulfobacterales bacterium]
MTKMPKLSRLQKLKHRLFKEFYEKKEWWGDDLTILDQAGVAEKPLIVRKALAIQKVCREMPLELKEDELIIGIPTMSSVGFGHTFPQYETDEEAAEAAKLCLNRKSVWGHHPPYFPKVLNRGVIDIIAETEQRLADTPESDFETREFYEAVKVALEGAEMLSLRYAEAAEFKARNIEDPKRKAELKEIARICRKVPMQPAESFHEALQSVWFIHIILHSCLNYTSLGRSDQYLWSYYIKDVESGKISREHARDLMGSWLIKFNERVQFNREHMEDHFTFGDWSQGGDPDEPTTHLDMQNANDYTFGQSANHWLQNIILSGHTPDGVDATNELSHMIIELVSELELIDPLLTVRLHKDSPEDIVQTTARALAKGGAQPAVYNDDVIVPGMVKYLNIPIEDARDYSNDGCWESLVYGRSEFSYGHIELLLSLESVLNRGASYNNGKAIGMDLGDPTAFKTFDEFYQAFKTDMLNRLDSAVTNKLKYYDEVHKIAPTPFLSAFIEDCLEKGKDLTNGGARYRFYAPLVTGLSHAVDSLAAIKKLVYEDGAVTMEQMLEALKSNWKGHEQLRQMCLNKAPKYGNDDDYADDIASAVLGDFCDRAEEWEQKEAFFKFPVGIGTFENYPRFGNNAGPSPDGRFAQEAISSNYSPAVGRDKNGPTAVLRSSTKFDLQRVNDGCPVDLKLSFSKSEEEGAQIVEGLIRSFVKMNGNLMTITKVSTETLRRAQEEPEKYASLRIRLGGLTAYFVQLAKPQQDEYIRRTQHGV